MADKLDPNRYAGLYEEPHLRAHVEEDELELELLRTKSERAKHALEDASERFRAIERQFKEYKHIRDDAASYAAEVQSKYDAQVSVVSLRKAYFHPMRKLPDETLERIFLFTIGDLTFVGKETTAEETSARRSQPFRLAKVCRRWRQVALQSGGVWSQIEFDFDKTARSSWYRMAVFLEQHQTKSRSAPITLCVRRQREATSIDRSLSSEIARLMPRCSTFLLYLSALRPSDTLLPLLIADTPKLVYARVEIDDITDFEGQSLQILPKAGALAYLWAKNLFGELATALPSLTQVTLVNLECSNGQDDIVQLLCSARQLSEIHLISPVVRYPSTAEVAVVAPPLSALTFDVADDCRLDRLALRVQFTSVAQLSLLGGYLSSKARVRFLEIVAKSVHIKQLRINSLNVASLAQLLAVIPHLSALTHLYVERSSFTKDMLRSLFKALLPVGKKTRPWPCPALLSVRLDEGCFFADDCDAADLLSSVKARVGAATGEQDAPVLLQCCVLEGRETDRRPNLQKDIDALILSQDMFG